MIIENSYRKAFFAAIFLHVFLGILLLVEVTSPRPVLVKETKNEPGQIMPTELATKPKQELVKAVSIDNQEVMDTLNRLKEERVKKQKAEQAHQLALKKQAEAARLARLQEQQQLAKLKEEAAKLALAKKKEIEEEQKRLKQLALQKEKEAKRLEELKNKQQQLEQKQRQEAEKLALLKKQQAEEQMKLAQVEQEKEAKLKQEEALKAQAEKAAAEKRRAAQAAEEAAEKAKIAGEVNKYKAMIVNAISQQWILPENVDSSLSSQFRIRLAPNGAVLEVSLTRSSGDPVLDRSAQTAIYKASPLPVPTDPATFDLFRDISLTVRPENVRG
ncbi:TolA colicin import membrane protein [Legionella beliardensis]|uniref:TolA colicin import membrane protein n=1 Tax=Legionella beliardensis TaxID=91822 RepID=A0A378I1V1_9GAMM|nr:cell envelope integrity protein TolA [Legionella beliardensis]STX29149.1 TolA colicin import membrane protein [Legionella beliardensis]